MTGMTTSGPLPKRSDDRIRTGAPTVEVKKLFIDQLISQEVAIPEANPEWHDVALLWYEGICTSAQSVYYEPSDWAVAYLIAESMDRELQDQVVAVIQPNEHGPGKVQWGKVPIKGASLNALKAMMTNLLVTEGDRRRAGIEVVRAIQNEDATDASDAEVVDMETERQRLAGNA